MTWLAWRQFRAQALVAALAAAASCALLWITHAHIARAVGDDELSRFYDNLRLLGTGLVGVPAFVGAFWGAPMVAREFEQGTFRMVWTQNISRRRWLATKLAVTALAAIALVGIFSAVFTWWSLPFDHIGNRIGTANFAQRGIVPVAYTLFGLALGVFAGTVIRRTVPAMAVTLAGFMVVRFSIQTFVREHLVAPVTLTRPTAMFEHGGGSASEASGAWVLSSKTVNAAGHIVSSAKVDRTVVDTCSLTRESASSAFGRCADNLGVHDVIRAHPASHFWPLQFLEAGIFVALAGTLVLATFWWIRHRAT